MRTGQALAASLRDIRRQGRSAEEYAERYESPDLEAPLQAATLLIDWQRTLPAARGKNGLKAAFLGSVSRKHWRARLADILVTPWKPVLITTAAAATLGAAVAGATNSQRIVDAVRDAIGLTASPVADNEVIEVTGRVLAVARNLLTVDSHDGPVIVATSDRTDLVGFTSLDDLRAGSTVRLAGARDGQELRADWIELTALPPATEIPVTAPANLHDATRQSGSGAAPSSSDPGATPNDPGGQPSPNGGGEPSQQPVQPVNPGDHSPDPQPSQTPVGDVDELPVDELPIGDLPADVGDLPLPADEDPLFDPPDLPDSDDLPPLPDPGDFPLPIPTPDLPGPSLP